MSMLIITTVLHSHWCFKLYKELHVLLRVAKKLREIHGGATPSLYTEDLRAERSIVENYLLWRRYSKKLSKPNEVNLNQNIKTEDILRYKMKTDKEKIRIVLVHYICIRTRT